VKECKEEFVMVRANLQRIDEGDWDGKGTVSKVYGYFRLERIVAEISN